MELSQVIDWNQVIKTLGSTAIVVAALAWLAKLLISGFFSNSMAVKLEEAKGAIKHEYDTQLQTLKGQQDAALADINAKADERLEHLKAALGRVERLEADLIKSRGESYGEIWTLTGALNLFGPSAAMNPADLSQKLRNWYFEHGWVLSDESAPHYFLVQEVLNFAMLKSISFARPGDNILYSHEKLRPVDVLRGLRHRLLGIEDRGGKGSYSLDEVRDAVTRWKADPGAAQDHSADEKAWMLFQFVLSTFRTRITKELGSRQALQTALGASEP